MLVELVPPAEEHTDQKTTDSDSEVDNFVSVWHTLLPLASGCLCVLMMNVSSKSSVHSTF